MERNLKRQLPQGKFESVSLVRSRTMAAIKGKHPKTTEVALRMLFVRSGITGWRLHARHLPGKPDFYFPRSKVAIFVDGCFWHGCPRCGHIPKTRRPFWRMKIARNQQRDRVNARILKGRGIAVMRIWEHSLAGRETIARVLQKISGVVC
jgi:DNA mismatch endonuclease, patch repair protein